jgi:hypothetical protein
MGRDPEATEGGVSGRGALSFHVPTASQSLPLEIQPAATRAIQAILDEAYAEASQTLIAHLETLRRLAAYLVEHERVDGDTFDKLFDGRLEVPTAGDEWRAAASRPRAWGDVVDLAGHRTRRANPPIAIAAAISAAGDATVAASTPIVAIAVEPEAGDPMIGIGGTGMVSDAPSAAIERGPAGGLRLPRRPRDRRIVARRARNTAAGWLHRAERWIRSTELDADRL